MDGRHIKSILQDALEDEVPASQIDLLPAVRSRLVAEKKSLYQQGEKMEQTKFRRLAFPALAVVAIFVIALTTPQGRAWAQEAVRFFQRINSPTVQLSDEQVRAMNEIMDGMDKQYDLPLVPLMIPSVTPEMAAIAGCETPQKSQSYGCQIAWAESELGFDLKEFREKPDGWEFKSILVNTNSQIAVMSFEFDIKYFAQSSTSFASNSSLQLIQGVGNFPDSAWNKYNPWEAVPADKVELVPVGGYKGEYVEGRFGLSLENSELTWSSTDRRRRLAWNDGTKWYLIDFEPNLNIPDTLGKEELIRLAESLTSSSRETSEPSNPDRLPSISDAETISGIDLKAPTLLPMDMDFSHARYLPDQQQVQLVYGINQDLIIHEWEGDPLDYKKPLGKYEYTCEIVAMNNEEALYCSFESKKMRSFLWWHRDGINYQMYYNDSLTSGGRMDREQMLLIAESMQDIDDFFKKGGRTYEQTAIYAQAFGMDLKKFPQTPPDWKYTTFWSDAKTKCIDLIYTSTTGNSTLYINQCGTDYRSNVSSFPSGSVERVKVEDDNGRYIAGGFSTTDDGRQTWDPTLPVKQLYWQEDGLWMHITLSGDQTLLLNQDDLINIAESLQ